jgi:hypothetical protein
MSEYIATSPYLVPNRNEGAFQHLRRGWVDRGLKECLELADAGDIDAKAVGGWMLFVSIREPRDLDRALRLLTEAHDSGSEFGTYGLAWLKFECGSREEAFELMRKAAAREFPPAVVDVGRFYLAGVGTRVDPRCAEYSFRSAMKLGHRLAAMYLADAWAGGRYAFWKTALGRIALLPTRLVCTARALVARYEPGGLIYVMRRSPIDRN